MYRIKLQSGEESEFSSFEELCFGIVSGIIGPDDEIYHARAAKWLPIQAHPDYKKAAAQAPPPSPAMASQSPAPPVGGRASHKPPEEEAGQDLMTLLDLEELTAFDPGKVQESAPLQEEADSDPEAEQLAPIEAREPEEHEANGHGFKEDTGVGTLEEPVDETDSATALETDETDLADEGLEAAVADLASDDELLAEDEASLEADELDSDDPSESEPGEAVAQLQSQDEADENQEAESSSDHAPVGEESVPAELDIDKETELYDNDTASAEELSLQDEETVVEMEEQDVMADEAEQEPPEAELDEADLALAGADGSSDTDYVAAEDKEDGLMGATAAETASVDQHEVEEDQPEVADLDDEDAGGPVEGSQDIDYVAAENLDDTPLMESEADDSDADLADDVAVEEVEADEDEVADEPAMDWEPQVDDESIEADDEAVDEPTSSAELEAEELDDEIEEDADVEDDDSREDEAPDVEAVAGADNDDAEEISPLGGPVVELDPAMDTGAAETESDDQSQDDAELVAVAEIADPIDEFQPEMDDDPFRDTFSPTPELHKPRRFPVLPVAIAAGVVVMGALGWILMGASGSEEPVTAPDPQTPAPATAPAANPDLNQQSLAAEDPSEDVQRRYDEAYDRARSRLDAELRRAGFAQVFASANFASEESMVTARAAVAGASLAVRAYAGREQAIQADFPEADPTRRESRAHREMSEDLLAVSERIYGVLLANMEAFAIRKGAMTITDPAVEKEYQRLLGEVDRLMGLAATADQDRAATIRRIARGIGATRPPPLAELAPPPVLPTDL